MSAKILIVDDEIDIVSMLGSFFESKWRYFAVATSVLCFKITT